MPKTCYTPKRFNTEHREIIDHANEVIEEYRRQGYDLTLRQLYYQFVSRDWLRNTQQNYKRLGGIISDARRAGLIDWEAIVDRTRNVRTPSHWASPASIVRTCADQFDVDWWANQAYRPEVWVEKDALVGVLETACEPWHVPYFSCRGYTSDSEVWSAAQRLRAWARRGQTPVVIHLGDHDPSGIDMSRDIADRLRLFGQGSIDVRRVALTMEQIEEVNPPPNPAKETDSRFTAYQEEYGDQSWELDALNPTYIGGLIADTLGELIDQAAWDEATERRDEGRRLLGEVATRWDRLTRNL